LKVTDENSRIRIQDPDPNPDPNPDRDPLVKGMDPRIRIRIHPKMSWIRNTDAKYTFQKNDFQQYANYILQKNEKNKYLRSSLIIVSKVLITSFCIREWAIVGKKTPLSDLQSENIQYSAFYSMTTFLIVSNHNMKTTTFIVKVPCPLLMYSSISSSF
jgi:hypothetical protein